MDDTGQRSCTQFSGKTFKIHHGHILLLTAPDQGLEVIKMNRLADTIFRGQLYYPWMLTGVKRVRMIPPDLEQYAWEKLRKAVIIDASNACEYFYAVSDQEVWKISQDFPNLTPPFPVFWIEMKRPSRIVSETNGVIDSKKLLPLRSGFLFEAYPINRAWNFLTRNTPGLTLDSARAGLDELMAKYGENWRKMQELYGAGASMKFTADELSLDFAVRDYDALVVARHYANTPDQAGWMMNIEFFIENEPEVAVGPMVQWVLLVDGSGAGLHQTRPFPIFAKNKDMPLAFLEMVANRDFPALLAVSLMHCKNVKSRLVVDPRAIRRQYSRTHGFEPVRYHTLNIKPVNPLFGALEERQNNNNECPEGEPHARHLHFRTYQDKGLFRKPKYTLFIPNTNPGKRTSGAAEKSEDREMGGNRDSACA